MFYAWQTKAHTKTGRKALPGGRHGNEAFLYVGDLVDQSGNTLGRISDMLVSRNEGGVALLRVDPSGPNAGDTNPVVPWNSVRSGYPGQNAVAA